MDSALETLRLAFVLIARASWQASAVAGAVWLLQWALRRVMSAGQRHALWLLVLARLLLPVSIEAPFSLFGAGWLRPPKPIARAERVVPVVYPVLDLARGVSGAELFVPVSATVVSAPAARAWSAGEIVALVWLAGAIALASLVAFRCRRASARVRRDAPITDLGLLRLVDECRRSSRVRAPLWVVETGEVPGPALFGLLVPTLLMPRGLLGRFSAEELRFILLHELAHVRRRDLALNWLVTTMQILHWFNPAVWLALSRLRAERELACDARVLRRLGRGKARAYGETIVRLAEAAPAAARCPTFIGILEANGRLKRRLRAIAAFDPQPPRTRWLAAGLVAALAAAALTDGRSRAASPPAAPGPAAALALRILDAETGHAIAGAVVNSTAVSDAAGEATVTASFPLEIEVRAPGYVRSTSVYPRPAGDRDRIDIRLGRARTVGGFVRDPTGRPIEGAEIRLAGGAAIRGAAARSGPDGGWSFSELPLRADPVALGATHPEYAEARYAVGTGPPAPREDATIDRVALEASEAVLVMEPGLAITGRVLDPHGRPIGGAEVRHSRDPNGAPAGTARTDAAGAFRFRNGAVGRAYVAIEGRGFVAARERIVVTRQARPIAFHLDRARVLRGRVVDARGNPVAGAAVTGPSPVPWIVKTAEDGSFSWDSAPPEAIPVWVHSSRLARGMKPMLLEPGDRVYEIRLSAPATLTIAGSVYDAETRAAVPRFKVTVQSPPVESLVASGAGGVFRGEVPQGLQPVALKIQAEGYLPRVVEVVASGAETRVDVGLARGAGPSGTVRLRGGRTAAGARLVLVGARGTASLTGTGELHSGSGDVARAESDAEGGFELRPVLAPLLLAAAHPRGFALVPLSRGPAPSELVLDPWGRVEGDVRRGGRWAGHEILTLEAAEERAALAITLQTESDASGRFTFEHVPAGAYRIAFRRRLENAGVSRPTQVRVVRAEAGRTVRVELGGRGRLLVGKIEFVGRRQPIAWNTFHHRLEALESPSGVIELAVEFSPFGSYRIEDVPEGRYRLRLQIPGFAQPVVRDVDVPPGPAAVPVNLGTMTFR